MKSKNKTHPGHSLTLHKEVQSKIPTIALLLEVCILFLIKPLMYDSSHFNQVFHVADLTQ